MPEPWEEILRELLCELYELIGVDCDNLGATPMAQIATVNTAYTNSSGPPQSDWPAANSTLDQVVDLQAEPANPLSTSVNTDLTNMIKTVRQKVT